MGAGELVKLKCRPGTLHALASSLAHFGPADGAPEWLVSAVWLCTDHAQFLTTGSVEVLPDGLVARTLSICTPEELSQHVRTELPDLTTRLRARGNPVDLPIACAPRPEPRSLEAWPSTYSMSILVRRVQRETNVTRISCGLLFTSAGDGSLLVGADTSTLAIVLSKDQELIGRYRQNCEELSATDYVALAGC